MSKELITSFYTAFQNLDAEKMASHYHELAYFSDPVFVTLTSEEVCAMWKMLIERSKGQLKIDFHTVEEAEDSASCIWEAKYTFSKTERPVHNVIKSKMTFEDGKIIIHEDSFNFWKWSQMALGMPGLLLGWSPLIKSKVRAQAKSALMTYLINETKS